MSDKVTPGYGTGAIHIVDREGNRVATLEWKGSIWDGKGKWIFFRDERIKEEVLRAVKVGKIELGNMRVDDMYVNASVVPVWQGFSGTYGGLTQVLPTFGMDVDRHGIEWPGGVNPDYVETDLH